eukprot:TRINITY_DN31649_c0_g1_i1.p1 TRINITY_DN31649_c0_g1~~TRINITY_DN31649_c0_g1_i1.p1  ORF type:complete len:135 (-),score=5.71 TRINITY_DN31649_c0_g1_i1:819-1223(-)
MFVKPRNPPFSPLFNHLKPKFISHSGQPSDSTSDRYTIINISFKDPDSEILGLNEMFIEPIAGIVKHGIVGGNIITASIKMTQIDMHLSLNGTLVEELLYSIHILTDDIIFHHGYFTMNPSHIIFIVGILHLLI